MIRNRVWAVSMLLLAGLRAEAAPIADPAALCKLPPPPAAGSEEFRRDAETLLRLQAERTPEQCEVARRERTVSLRSWFGPETGVLTEAEVRRAGPAALQVFATVGAWSAICKRHFRRLRPYMQIPELSPCIERPKQPNLSYPSGHAAVSNALAIVLARMFPAKAERILRQGFQIGENRALSGVHFPSDVAAGRSFSKRLMQELEIR